MEKRAKRSLQAATTLVTCLVLILLGLSLFTPTSIEDASHPPFLLEVLAYATVALLAPGLIPALIPAIAVGGSVHNANMYVLVPFAFGFNVLFYWGLFRLMQHLRDRFFRKQAGQISAGATKQGN